MKSLAHVAIALLCLVLTVFIGSRIDALTLDKLSDIVHVIAGAAVAYAAVFALEAWKRQKRYERHVDVATEIMAHLFEFQERFVEARNPVGTIPGTIDIADTEALKKYQVEERSRKLTAVTDEYNRLVTAVAKLGLWQEDFCKAEMQALRTRVGELIGACQAYYGIDWSHSTPDMNKLSHELYAKMWGTPDDEFGKVVVENAETIRKACRKLTR